MSFLKNALQVTSKKKKQITYGGNGQGKLCQTQDAAAIHAKLIGGKHSGPKEENQGRPFLRGLNNWNRLKSSSDK